MSRTPAPTPRLPFVLTVLVALGLVAYAIAGDLTPPPGPVSPTFKTLDDLEPRRALRQSDVPITIVSSGSYYLAEDLVAIGSIDSVIRVTAPDVTLDLRGFCISGQSLLGDAQHGIEYAGVRSIEIRDGVIRDCLDDGISSALGTNDAAVVIRDMRIHLNGDDGINGGDNNVRVRDCTVQDNAGEGIVAIRLHARDCFVTDNGPGGIVTFDGLVTNCVVLGHKTNLVMLSGEQFENHAP